MASSQSEGHTPQNPVRDSPWPVSSSPMITLKQALHKGTKIDGRVRILQTGISARHSCHNSTLPVVSLPVEILTIIIFHVMERDILYARDIGWHQRHKRESLGWIKMTHVCRRWRQVALATPLLWRNVVWLRADGMETMLHRAARAPLRVDLVVNLSKFRHRLAPLQNACSRLQALSLEAFRDTRMSRWKSVALIPHSLLCEARDSMQHLSLKSVYCDWGRLCFPAMVSLKLSYGGWIGFRPHDHHIPTVSTLASVLATMPKLQTLHLSNAISPKSLKKDSMTPSTRIPLPRLSELEVHESNDFNRCTLLLRYLAVPREAKVQISSKMLRSVGELDPQGLAAHLDEIQGHIVAFQARATPAFHLRIAFDIVQVVVRAQGPVPGSFKFAFNIGRLHADEAVMASVLRKLPLADADHLELGPFDDGVDELFDWYLIFGMIDLKLRKARTVTIHLARPEVLHALLERDPAMMPLLETLVLRIKVGSAIGGKDFFKQRMEELSSVKTIEVHMEEEGIDLEPMEKYLEGVRPEVLYSLLED
ncbi:hypothetical protein DENSPDRAFT_670365 [Dentipellis sp. KUC8613]|nr:hypothetical protein DENSPDRAFT_670365 [Dentipellis sp. KUC8613]